MVRPALPAPTSLPPLPPSARSYMPTQDSDALLARLADTKTPYEPRSKIAYRGGEDTALARLEHYCAGVGAPLFTYKRTRNSLSGTDDSSHFSPFLAVGALSARSVFWRVRAAEQERKGGGNEDSYWLLFELLWRDYWKHAARPGAPLSHNRMFRLFGTLSHPDDGDVRALEPGQGKKSMKGERPKREERKVEAKEEWKTDAGMFRKWKEGTTGVPFVDANMRELAATGAPLRARIHPRR
jgi:deoxyribodipyrimidine photo-lyase